MTRPPKAGNPFWGPPNPEAERINAAISRMEKRSNEQFLKASQERSVWLMKQIKPKPARKWKGETFEAWIAMANNCLPDELENGFPPIERNSSGVIELFKTKGWAKDYGFRAIPVRVGIRPRKTAKKRRAR